MMLIFIIKDDNIYTLGYENILTLAKIIRYFARFPKIKIVKMALKKSHFNYNILNNEVKNELLSKTKKIYRT